MKDYFGNSVFIPEEYKTKMNLQLHSYFEQLANDLVNHGIKANIYLSGSLARKEPALGLDANGNCFLASDIDFVFGIENDFEKDDWLVDITNYLNRKYSQFVSSVVLIKNENIPKIKSRIGRDLMKVVSQPLYQQIDIPSKVEVTIGVQDYIDNIINQMACYYLHPKMNGEESNSIMYKDITNHYMKLVFESLSAILYLNRKEQVEGFFEVYHNRFNECFKNVISPNLIENLLKARELKNKFPVVDVDVNHLVIFALNQLLEENYRTAKNVYELLEMKSYAEMNIINSFQTTMICWVIGRNIHEIKERKDWVYLMLSNMNYIAEYKNIDLRVKQLETIDDLWENKQKLNTVLNDLRELREVYIRAQYYKNTGVDIIPDLNQKNKP